MRKISLLVLTVFLGSDLFAQEDAKFGLKGGLNLATLTSERSDLDSRTSFHIGALAHTHLTNQWALQPELVFSGQGYEGNNNYHEKLSYINVPVMAQYMFNNGFRIEAGPQLGFMVNAEGEDRNDTESDRDHIYEKVDFGVGLGLSYLTYTGLGFGARYNLGLSDINDIGTDDSKNRVFQLGVFYLFDHKHKAKSR